MKIKKIEHVKVRHIDKETHLSPSSMNAFTIDAIAALATKINELVDYVNNKASTIEQVKEIQTTTENMAVDMRRTNELLLREARKLSGK